MKLENIHTLCHLPVPISKAWNFFADLRNLERITPSFLSKIRSGG